MRCPSLIRITTLGVIVLAGSFGISAEPPAATKPSDAKLLFPPRSPVESLASIRVKEGYEVELVAAEPLVASPVAIDWDADGSLWVVEMADYPTGIDGKGKPGGRIKHLESSRGDGVYDKATVVLDGVRMPNGIATWRDGVLVTAAPDILHLRSGDRKAQVLFTGFKEGNPQLRINGLRWGMDGWVYCANGWSGGEVKSTPGKDVLKIDNRDIRIQPDLGLIDLQSGVSQFGRERNDWGDWFGCDNSHPLFHFVLEDQYLRRNHDVPTPNPKRELIVPANPRVFGISAVDTLFDRTLASPGHIGHFTSACSVMIYRDELLFGRDGPAHAFVCEPVHNVIHHAMVCEDGISFKAARAEDEKEREFFASQDPWCRPVMARMGPDGALWVVDMYRYMIEHPDWLPPGGKERMTPLYREGDDRGRIYRIYPKGHRPGPIPRLDKMDTAALVATMESPNGWVRDKAQQLLMWKNDRAAVELLVKLVRESKSPLARAQALWTLEGLKALDAATIELALHDPHPGVRRQAVRLAEPRGKQTPSLVLAAVSLVDDPDVKVRMQLACTLGEWNGPQAAVALARLAISGNDDPQWAAAIISSASEHYPALADALLAAGRPVTDPLFRDLLTLTLAKNDRVTLSRLLASVLMAREDRYTPSQIAVFARFVEGLSLHRSSIDLLQQGAADGLSQQLQAVPRLFDAARKLALDTAGSVPDRSAAISLLGYGSPSSKEVDALAGLLVSQSPPDVQAATVKAIAKIADPRTPELLLRRWAALSPPTRSIIVDVLAAREPWAWQLLQEVKAGKVPVIQFDVARRQRLLKNASERIRSLAATVFGGAEGGRQKVVEQHMPVLGLTGVAARGAKVFAQNCATCHHLGDVGNEIGPDLRSVSGWEGDALLVAILDPSRQVEPRYLSYTITLAGGEVAFGIITAETAESVTLKGLDAKETVLPRSGIKSMEGGDRSLMPDGLEAALSDQDLADVIRFVRNGGSAK